jgi:hypothetical protein
VKNNIVNLLMVNSNVLVAVMRTTTAVSLKVMMEMSTQKLRLTP